MHIRDGLLRLRRLIPLGERRNEEAEDELTEARRNVENKRVRVRMLRDRIELDRRRQ